jgi:hypothetical protein
MKPIDETTRHDLIKLIDGREPIRVDAITPWLDGCEHYSRGLIFIFDLEPEERNIGGSWSHEQYGALVLIQEATQQKRGKYGADEWRVVLASLEYGIPRGRDIEHDQSVDDISVFARDEEDKREFTGFDDNYLLGASVDEDEPAEPDRVVWHGNLSADDLEFSGVRTQEFNLGAAGEVQAAIVTVRWPSLDDQISGGAK